MKQNKYLVVYQLNLINGNWTTSKKYSKIIELDRNDISEENIWNKLSLPDNCKSKIILSLQRL